MAAPPRRPLPCFPINTGGWPRKKKRDQERGKRREGRDRERKTEEERKRAEEKRRE